MNVLLILKPKWEIRIQKEVAKKVVGPDDMINNASSKKPIMHQTHWNNWKKTLEEMQKVMVTNLY